MEVVRAARRSGESSRAHGHYYRPAIERLRFYLMPFVCIYLFGAPTRYGTIIRQVCGFAPIAFFILSGYLVLRGSYNRSARILRAIRRSAIAFVALAAAFFLLNILYALWKGEDFFAAFPAASAWLDFALFNIWPFEIGGSIWYVQSLLYAYILIYFLNKFHLLKWDWIIAAVCLIFTVITGELSGIIPLNILGHTAMSANFVTRALPYLLLGSFIHRNMEFFSNIHKPHYYTLLVIGTLLCAAEPLILQEVGITGVYDHLLGMPLMAVAVCMLIFKRSKGADGFEIPLNLTRRDANWLYYLCEPVALVLSIAMQQMFETSSSLHGYIGVATFVVCALLVLFVASIRKTFAKRNAALIPDRDT